MTAAAGSCTWSRFPPHVLREYALIADGRRGVLCGPRGEMVWLCAPRWDSPAVLSSLMGGEGIFAITPSDPSVWGGYYEPGSLIWRSRWTTPTTRLECREALARPAHEHCTVILRRIEATDRPVSVDLLVDLRADFGREPMHALHRDDQGVWTARTGDLWARLTGAASAGVEAGRLHGRIDLAPGSRHDVMLEISDRPLGVRADPDVRWQETENSWQTEVPTFSSSLAPTESRHSYALLSGLTTPGGGMVAAATLGLPERAEQGRNYDYRYVWLRDQAYAGLACAVTEPLPLFDQAVDLLAARMIEHGPAVAPAYRVDGSPLPHESDLHLSGYPGGADVVGNWVTGQFQLDALGEMLQLFGTALGFDVLDRPGRRALDLAVQAIAERWQQPEAGIWELDDRWWTHSRLACVAGLRTAARFLPRARAADLDRLADTILTATTQRCLHPSGRWQRASDDPDLDAALLLPPVRGALDPADSRTTATMAAIETTLVEDGHVYRFAQSDAPLGQDEGAFVLCGFMMALAQWQQGRQPEAVHYFERACAACGPPALYAEEFDVRQRQLRGNLPQGFVHALMLEAAQRLPQRPGAARG